jgi:hypothetical protein
VAALRAQSASARARQRSRIAASSTGGTETGGRAPERINLANGIASRRSVVTRSPGVWGMREGPPPVVPFFAQRALEPGATRAGCRDKDEAFGL